MVRCGTVSRHTAIRLQVEVGPDRTIRLPDDFPVGPAEVIVLVPESRDRTAPDPVGLIGLFADEPEVVDEAMEHVRERRKSWRMRPVE